MLVELGFASLVCGNGVLSERTNEPMKKQSVVFMCVYIDYEATRITLDLNKLFVC